MIKMVVFDMAGTTVDEDNVVYKTLHTVLSEAGFEVSLEQVLWLGAGKEKLQAVKDLLASLTGQVAQSAQAETLYAQFMERLRQAYQTLEVKSFEGTETLFEYLQQKGIKVVLNTGYSQAIAHQLLAQLGWQVGKEYDLLVTADHVSRGRPHPDMILFAMEEMKVSEAKSVVKIGDSAIDIEEGKAAGCGLSIGVTTGAQSAEQLKQASPDHVIHALPVIKAWI